MDESLAGKSGRTFVLGAGVSAEIGAPTVSIFLPMLLDLVPPRRVRRIRELNHATRGHHDIEALLARLDQAIARGESWNGFKVPWLRRARQELLNAVAETLDRIQFQHLRTHLGYQRSDNPYYFAARDFRIVDSVKTDYAGSPFETQVAETNARRWALRRSRTIDETDWANSVEWVLEALFRASRFGETLRPLYAAAFAAGRDRFATWLPTVWPFVAMLNQSALRLAGRRWNRDSVLDGIAELLQLSEAGIELGIESARQARVFLRDQHERLTNGRGEVGVSYERELRDQLADKLLAPLAAHSQWRGTAIEGILSAAGDGGVDPYYLLAGQLAAGDGIVSLNYDLFAEMALGVLEPNTEINYGLPDVIVPIPWDPHGPIRHYGYLGATGTPLLKIHGSINWLECLSCGQAYCFLETPARSAGPANTLAWIHRYWERLEGEAPCCDLYQARRTEIKLVPPAAKKDLWLGFLSSAWRAAREQIARSDEIIFVGYSFSPSDADIRRLILDAAQTRSRTFGGDAKRHPGPIKVSVVNRSLRAWPHYEAFFAGRKEFELAQPLEVSASQFFGARLTELVAAVKAPTSA